MQLGARWRVGHPPHPGAPASLHSTIAELEAELPEGASWTLTWLEGRPRAELLDSAGETVAEVRVAADGAISAVRGGSGTDLPHTGDGTHPGVPDDDDDDWLS